jgi:hypothetical protein
MKTCPRIHGRFVTATVAASFLCLISVATAQDTDEARLRLKLMQEAVESLKVESKEIKTNEALTAGGKPLIRYADPTRGGDKNANANLLLDAGIWRLGTEGRPTALITVELYQTSDGSRLLSYEFLALSEKAFTLSHKTRDKIHWEPAESGLTVKDLPDAPKPATTQAARLIQMRALAQRFSVTETYNKQPIDCRLMGQPIDRYQSEQQKIVDGAVFAFANGTNPEIGVLLETDGDHWRYGILRMTSTAAKVNLDGKEVLKYESFYVNKRTDWPYHYVNYRITEEK